MDLNEFKTRKKLIDVSLKNQGWDVDNRAQVRVEIDTKQSNFQENDYKSVDETLTNDLDSIYADYILLDDVGAPLAIIEAKRTSKDALTTAKNQAEEYAKDIIKQTNKPIFIFLSNGHETWFWNYPSENPRMVKDFFPKEDLMKKKWINENKEPLKNYDVTHITDRPKSIECTKRVLEHISNRHRKALIVMATGTGKTRVAMAIIDVLKKYKWVKKVLFIADRRTLRNQAYSKGFKKFFPHESKEKIYSGTIDKDKNLYATTIQTLQECYSEISPAYFDLIISDEAHRSIYNKWKDIFTYYDCIQIGLTATPREAFNSDDMRDTFRFFECENNTPTALYDYEEAVDDDVLVDFRKHILGAQTKHQIEGLKRKHLTESQVEQLIQQGQDPNDIDFEGTDFEKKFVTIGTNEAFIREFMENCLTDQSGTVPAKSIIFAMTKKHAKRLLEAFYRLYPDYTNLANIIISEDSRAQKAIENFEKESLPRIAISVDMLDTGVDIPEICNLVFAKPVFSKIKFWQMLGRGTRSNDICEHKGWLPDGEKKFFKVFDYFKNFEYFNMKPEGAQSNPSEAISIRIFRTQVEQLILYQTRNDEAKVTEIKNKIRKKIISLPQDSIPVKERLEDINKAISEDFYDRIGINPILFLNTKISPLMKYLKTNYNEASFILKCERLKVAILRTEQKQIDKFSELIAETLECIPENINGLNIEYLRQVRRESFWKSINVDEVEKILTEFVDFIKYKTKEPRVPIIVDMDDLVVQRTIIEFGPEGNQEHVKSYKERVEKKIKELVEEHPTIKKILKDEKLTDEDLEKLEDTLNSPDLYLTEDVLKQFYKGTFVQFIKEIFGLYKQEKVEDKVKNAFETHLVSLNRQYTADQFNFLRTLQAFFSKTKHIDYDMLWGPPFENLGIPPTDLFEENELKQWVNFCKELESEI